jgi:hypothetical protein
VLDINNTPKPFCKLAFACAGQTTNGHWLSTIGKCQPGRQVAKRLCRYWLLAWPDCFLPLPELTLQGRCHVVLPLLPVSKKPLLGTYLLKSRQVVYIAGLEDSGTFSSSLDTLVSSCSVSSHQNRSTAARTAAHSHQHQHQRPQLQRQTTAISS